MERLTENNKCKLSNGEDIVICKHSENDCNDSCMKIIPCKWYIKAMNKLKRYEDLEEQGRLIKLPCKVGDTVYHVVQGRIVEVSNVDLFFLLLSVVENRFNNSVFLTKSEAEAKLKELRGGENDRETEICN